MREVKHPENETVRKDWFGFFTPKEKILLLVFSILLSIMLIDLFGGAVRPAECLISEIVVVNRVDGFVVVESNTMKGSIVSSISVDNAMMTFLKMGQSVTVCYKIGVLSGNTISTTIENGITVR